MTPGVALAISEYASITEIEAGHVLVPDQNLVISDNQAELDCVDYRMFYNTKICTTYGPSAPMDTPGDIVQSNNDRYFVNPLEGRAAMRIGFQAGASLLSGELQRIELTAEVSQSSAGSPIMLVLRNYRTGELDLMGSYSGTTDGTIRYSMTNNLDDYLFGNQMEAYLINSSLGIPDGTGYRRGGMYIDLVQIRTTTGPPIPEPSAAILTSLGLLGLALIARRFES